MDSKINNACDGVIMFANTMITMYKVNPELLWVRIRQEADYQLELLREVDSPTE